MILFIDNITFMESIPYKYDLFIIYLIVSNLIGFLCMLVDKRRAVLHQWRIRESTLLLLALIGGSFGIFLGMTIFHHKTRKLRFVIGIPAILIIQFLFLCYSRGFL